jgi:hypothetical protein
VQTVSGVELRLTGRPEDAVAFRVKAALFNAWFAGAVNVIVWVASVTVNCWLTDGAAA